jgi:hypothetical protein
MAPDEYLRATRDHYEAYHNHKEQMAYAATTLYLALLTAVAAKPCAVWEPAISKAAFVRLVFASAVIGFSFVVWQLRNREFAADLVRACGDLLTETVASSLNNPDLAPTTYGQHELPYFLVARLRLIGKDRRFFGPRFSEAITYSLMLGWTIGALIRVDGTYC